MTTAEQAELAKQKKAEKVAYKENVVIIGTGKSSFLKEGVEYKTGVLTAKELVKSGKATAKK
jgi:uncharacterized phosphosugar-binding protein